MYRRKTDYGPFIVAIIMVAGLVGYIYCLLTFNCPPGTKTISKPMSFEKYCVEE